MGVPNSVASVDVWLCVDCGVLAVNGEIPQDPLVEAACMVGFDRVADDGFIVACGDSDRDHTFSWSSCDVCGTSLGGFRFHAVLLPR